MEQSDEEWTHQVYELFRERRLVIKKMPIAQMERLISGLKKYKSEHTEAIDIFQVLLYRKKQFVLKQLYCMKFDEKENNQEYQFFHQFEDMMDLKKEDFQDGDYQLDQPYSSAEEEDKKRRNVKDSIVEVENLLKKDLREFTFLLLYLVNKGKISFTRMPIYHITRFIQGLKWLKKQDTKLIEFLEILLAYKEAARYTLSEKDSRRNKQFLKERYSQKVDNNKNQKDASEWKDHFEDLESFDSHDFRDGCYIEGLISQQSLAKKIKIFSKVQEKSSKGQNPSIFEILIVINQDHLYIFQESFYLQQAEKLAKTSCGQNVTVVKCQRGILGRFNQNYYSIPITVVLAEKMSIEKKVIQRGQPQKEKTLRSSEEQIQDEILFLRNKNTSVFMKKAIPIAQIQQRSFFSPKVQSLSAKSLKNEKQYEIKPEQKNNEVVLI